MPNAANKPGIDWIAIRRQYEAGQPVRDIERQLRLAGGPTVSHQRIAMRAKKEGWKIAAAPLGPDPRRAFPPHRSAEAEAIVLDHALTGTTRKRMAAAVGMTVAQLAAWAEDDDGFARKLARAEADFEKVNLDRMGQAADRGDWRAAESLLTKAQATKQDYAAPTATAFAPGINVIIQIPDPGQTPLPVAPPVLDLRAEEG